MWQPGFSRSVTCDRVQLLFQVGNQVGKHIFFVLVASGSVLLQVIHHFLHVLLSCFCCSGCEGWLWMRSCNILKASVMVENRRERESPTLCLTFRKLQWPVWKGLDFILF